MSTGKIELSVGAVKIADKYEMFTEEEILNIDKIPAIEDELEESVKFEIVGEGMTVPPITGGGSNYDDTEIRGMINEISSSLDNITYIPKSNGVDDTKMLKSIFENIDNGCKVLFSQHEKYKISEPIIISKSNIIIDFNSAIIEWNGTENLGASNSTDRIYGCFTIKGGYTDVESKVLSVITDKIEKIYNGVILTVDNISNFKVGDFIKVEVKSKENWNSDFSDYSPRIFNMCKILKIEGNNIFTDYSTPFVFDTVTSNSRIVKMNVVDNVVINNMNYIDNTAENYPSLDGDRGSFVSGLNIRFCSNVTINNYTSNRHKFPSIFLYYTHNVTINGAKGYNASSSGAGLGYLIQCCNSIFVNIHDVEGENISPCVDFSGSSHCMSPSQLLNVIFSISSGNSVIPFPRFILPKQLVNVISCSHVPWHKNLFVVWLLVV